MKKKFIFSGLLSLILVIAPFFLFSFDIQPGEEDESVVQQDTYYEYKELGEIQYNDVYRSENIEEENIGNDAYYHEPNYE